jgi:copper chaperone NosL
MQRIEPDSTRELRFMKYFAAGLAAAALLVALVRRRALLLTWVIVAVVLSGIGMYDFYQWEYRYGHELDPSAAIKVPGMSYQPPMFGTKQMLNFQTTAWPGIAGWMAMVAVGLGVVCVFYEYWLRRRAEAVVKSTPAMTRPTAAAPAALLVSAALVGALSTGCSKEPATLEFGTDACAYCSMTISDQRHGALFVSDKGRTYKFDAIECMVDAQTPGEKLADIQVHSFHVVDYSRPGVVVDATTATYLVSPAVPSPMGANVSAFEARDGAESVKSDKGGDVFDWDGIREHLKNRSAS